MRFSANLGFLFTDLPLPDAIRAAKRYGFDAVECHFPYDFDAEIVKAALTETGLAMLGLNTVRGDLDAGEFGLSALPDAQDRARAAIDQAVAYAAAIGAQNVHVMAGKTGGGAAAEAMFRGNLAYACKAAAPHGIGILIEPINHRDAPGYHLSTADHAAEIIADLGLANLKMMFDCYHLEIMQGDLVPLFKRHAKQVGHVQIAALPDRGEPDSGTLDYAALLPQIEAMGFTAPIGAEYRPRTQNTVAGLGWLSGFQALTPNRSTTT